MRLALASLGVAAACLAQPGLACSDPPESYDRQLSDAVVDGRLRCEFEINRCSLSVSRYLKPSRWRRVDDRALQIKSENGTMQGWIDEGLIVLMCPGPFEPELEDFFGRFYLMFDEKDGLYRVRRYYVRDRDGEFYHLGIRCGPDFVNEQGNTARECWSVEDTLRSQEQ